MSTWVEALDELEALLAEQRAALESGQVEGMRFFEPPPDLGPLPVELIDRAQALYDTSEALAQVALTIQAGVGRQLAVTHRLAEHSGAGVAAARTSSFVDSRD